MLINKIEKYLWNSKTVAGFKNSSLICIRDIDIQDKFIINIIQVKYGKVELIINVAQISIVQFLIEYLNFLSLYLVLSICWYLFQ